MPIWVFNLAVSTASALAAAETAFKLASKLAVWVFNAVICPLSVVIDACNEATVEFNEATVEL